MVTGDICRYMLSAAHNSVAVTYCTPSKIYLNKMAINNGPWDSVCLYSAVFDGHVLYLIECLLARFAVEKPTYTQAWSQ